MIRLLLTVATAAAVVWFVGSRPDAFAPESEQARRVLERAADAVEQVVGQVGERAAEAFAPDELEASPEVPAERSRAEEVVADEEPAIERPASPVVAAESEFGPEAPGPIAPAPGAGTAEDLASDSMVSPAGPLDAERAALVRARLDRVMSLAAGSSR